MIHDLDSVWKEIAMMEGLTIGRCINTIIIVDDILNWAKSLPLHGGSYLLEHCLHPKRTEKKHATNLTPYPSELIPFEPVDGANMRYGQLY